MYINFYLFQIPYNITHVCIIYDVDKCKQLRSLYVLTCITKHSSSNKTLRIWAIFCLTHTFFLSQLHGFVWKTSIKHGYMYCTFINTIFEYRAMFFVLIPMYIMYEVCIEEIKPRKV